MTEAHPEFSPSISSMPAKERIAIESARHPRSAWRPIRWLLPRPKGSAVVRIRVRQLSQLFNSLDPSPFWDRDLDGQAADFIEGEFRDRLSADTWRLVVQVHEGSTSAEELQTALKNHYLRQANSARLALREHLWVGQLALGGGVTVFLVSMTIRAVLRNSWQGISPWVEEGLVVLAWLALWRPAEALLYGWVPYYRKRRRYERLARIHVAVRLSAPAATDNVHPKSAAPSTNAQSVSLASETTDTKYQRSANNG